MVAWLQARALWLLLAAAGIAAAWLQGHEAGAASERALRDRDELLVMRAGAAAADAAASAVAREATRLSKLAPRVEREIRSSTVYQAADCRLPDGGMRLANEALAGGASAAGSGGVPEGAP